MKPDCLFCKIARDQETVIWENDDFAAFKDIYPKARVHVLIVPKNHVETFNQLNGEAAPGLAYAIQEVAKNQGVDDGYRLQINVGAKGGQEVDHLHVHLMAD